MPTSNENWRLELPVPTGVAIHDVREQLFAAAERVLLHAGPSGLTSRAVTMEAGFAKGVLHRHFSDFDDFLAQLVLDQARSLDVEGQRFIASAGAGDLAQSVTDHLLLIFRSAAGSMIRLMTFRDELRDRLRETWPTGVPLLTEAVSTIAAYLQAEQRLERVAGDADTRLLAQTLVGATHLLLAELKGPDPQAAVNQTVAALLAQPPRCQAS